MSRLLKCTDIHYLFFFFKFDSHMIHGEGGGGCQIMMVRKAQPLIVFVSIEIIYKMSEQRGYCFQLFN